MPHDVAGTDAMKKHKDFACGRRILLPMNMPKQIIYRPKNPRIPIMTCEEYI